MVETPAFAPLEPGAVIGVLGGGQLGRMLAMAAAKLGLKAHIFAPEADSPAFEVAAHHTCAPYDDAIALEAFARSVDVVTFEFENVPSSALAAIEALVPARPGRRALEAAQDRLKERELLAALEIPTADWRLAPSGDGLEAAWRSLNEAQPGRAKPHQAAYLKRLRHGYDGKGQMRIASGADLKAASAWLGMDAAILEAEALFAFELSVIVARGADGAVSFYDPPRNKHVDGVLRESVVPSGAPAAVEAAARAYALRLVEGLDYVGVLALEMFAVREAGGEMRLIANEIAPRVHNSGHWTIEACAVSQFENHIRAVAGWPLGSAERFANARMINILGAESANWSRLLSENPGRSLHLYGKGEPRSGRKMGHFTELSRRS
jgi:5-(carboxyamino)imidazole ribonucleotide synthase